MLRPHRAGGGGQGRHRGVPHRVGCRGAPSPLTHFPQPGPSSAAMSTDGSAALARCRACLWGGGSPRPRIRSALAAPEAPAWEAGQELTYLCSRQWHPPCDCAGTHPAALCPGRARPPRPVTPLSPQRGNGQRSPRTLWPLCLPRARGSGVGNNPTGPPPQGSS